MRKPLAILLAVSLMIVPFSSCAKRAGPGVQTVSDVSSDSSAVSEAVSSAPSTVSSVPAVYSAPAAQNAPVSKAWGVTQAVSKAASKPVAVKPPINTDLMANIHAANIQTVAPPDAFYAAETNFSLNLLKNSVKSGQNCLLSPLSVYAALGMAENGAAGNTLKEFESVLGGGLSVDSLDLYIKSYLKDLAAQNDVNTKLNVADSIWLDKRFTPKAGFLQKNADYFGAGVFKADFASPSAPGIINRWVAEHTENKITDLVQDTSSSAAILINAMVFHSNWDQNFSNTHNETFTPAAGKAFSSAFMEENSLPYLSDGSMVGALVPFSNSRFALAVILPGQGVSLSDTVQALDTAKFRKMLKNPLKNCVADIILPKFTTKYGVDLTGSLRKMGLADAFLNGDYSAAAPGLGFNEVIHKTVMTIDEKGADAVAATMIDTKSCKGLFVNSKTQVMKIDFNRPFVYAIVDTSSGIPLFIGTMENPKA